MVVSPQGIKIIFSHIVDRDMAFKPKDENLIVMSEGIEYLTLFALFGLDEGIKHCMTASQKHLNRILNKY